MRACSKRHDHGRIDMSTETDAAFFAEVDREQAALILEYENFAPCRTMRGRGSCKARLCSAAIIGVWIKAASAFGRPLCRAGIVAAAETAPWRGCLSSLPRACVNQEITACPFGTVGGAVRSRPPIAWSLITVRKPDISEKLRHALEECGTETIPRFLLHGRANRSGFT